VSTGAAELLKAKNSEDIQAIFSILAIAAGAAWAASTNKKRNKEFPCLLM
jgi:hypothetical protein